MFPRRVLQVSHLPGPWCASLAEDALVLALAFVELLLLDVLLRPGRVGRVRGREPHSQV